MINKSQQEIVDKWIGDVNNPKVTIRCMAYNHQSYIEEALDSFLMQETNFPFEILVHDDASTDGTREIIEKYYSKYPIIIKPMLEDKNQYSKGAASLLLNITKNYTKGKYVAFCEGDDYWVDNTKLQKQYDLLEKNNNCFLCVHKTKIIGDTRSGDLLPITNFTEGIIKSEDFLNTMNVYNFHTSSFFLNKEKLLDYYSNDISFKEKVTVGDIPLMLFFGYIGDVFYISKTMSVYRKNHKSSWTDNNLRNTDLYVKNADSMINMMKSFNIYSNYKYDNMCNKYINSWEFNVDFRKNNYKELMKKKYSGYRKLLSISRRFIIYTGYFFPKIANYIIEIHDNRR